MTEKNPRNACFAVKALVFDVFGTVVDRRADRISPNGPSGIR
jgi:hypothetical protein